MTLPECGAKTKAGTPCQLKGSGVGGRCRLHGGASPKPGPSHPGWKHGRASQFAKSLPKHLRESFDIAVRDPDLLSVRSEISLLDARVIELIERLTTGESEELLAEAQAKALGLRAALDHDPVSDDQLDVARGAVDQLVELLGARLDDERQWRSIRKTLDQRRKMSETERRLIEAKRAAVDADRLQTLLGFLLHLLREHVVPLEGGPEAVTEVAWEMRKLIGQGPGSEESDE